jgi:ribosomal protein S4
MGYQVLTTEQAEQFVEHGYVAIRGCFSREAAARYT